MAALSHALGMALAMGWEILWPLILGFALSAVIQAVVSHVLHLPRNKIVVQAPRMGGGFGGKETQGNSWAALAAQILVFVLYFKLTISYLWYPIIGCAACVLFSLALQAALGGEEKTSRVPAP